MNIAFLFPGQGSQYVGMGKDLAQSFPIVREVYEQVDDALGYHLSRIVQQGPEETLKLTCHAQPALMMISMAIVRLLESQGQVLLSQKATCVAGHSLGEYSALCAMGAFSIETCAQLLHVRATAMQQATPQGRGTMAAIIGMNADRVGEILSEFSFENPDEICEIANDNAQEQVVVSGMKTSVDAFMKKAKNNGAKRCIELSVSAPFHSSLMKSACEKMARALEDIELNPLQKPFVSNVTAKYVDDVDLVKDLLIDQIIQTVRWRESMLYMKDKNIDCFVELGAGKVLSSLAKRMDKKIVACNVESCQDIDYFMSNFY